MSKFEIKNHIFWNNKWIPYKFSKLDRLNLHFDGYYRAFYDKTKDIFYYVLQCQKCNLIFLSKHHYRYKKHNVDSCPLCSTQKQPKPIKNVLVVIHK